MGGADWLTAHAIAHRGLHDASAGVIENTAAAFSAAVAAGYGIETDLQISADGEAMVHHDGALGRLTEGGGVLAEMSAGQIQAVRFKTGGGRILTLGELCDLVGGRVTLLLELKSHFDGNLRLVDRTVEVLKGYAGPVAVMSFDPDLIQAVRYAAPGLRRGIVAERNYSHPEWNQLTGARKQNMTWLLHAPRSRPQFLPIPSEICLQWHLCLPVGYSDCRYSPGLSNTIGSAPRAGPTRSYLKDGDRRSVSGTRHKPDCFPARTRAEER